MIRIFRQIELNRLTGCWIWTGAKQVRGYGVVGKGRRREGLVRVHRAVYEDFVRPLLPGEELHHECQNTACCNPAHLTPHPDHASHMAQHR